MTAGKPSIRDQIGAAKKHAAALHPILTRQARRPFVLEITGTPKAGKTTLIGMLDSFLRACGYRVHVLKERASECPLPMKGHFFFNTWTTGTMLAGLLDAVDREHDVVILDRGLFDALIWLSMQVRQGQVSKKEREVFESFVMLERWRQLVDGVCIVETNPLTAMERENHGRLLPRKGSVMNVARLADFNAAMQTLARKRRRDFDLIPLSNSEGAKEGALALIDATLQAISKWCDPEIAVVERTRAEQLVRDGATSWSARLERELLRTVKYKRRSSIETDDAWVQLLACGVQTHAGEVFLVCRRPQRDRKPHDRDNTALIWRGCHIARPPSGALTVAVLEEQLKDRLRGDLHLAEFKAKLKPKGLVWLPGGKEPRHLGLVFVAAVSDNIAEWLDEKNFKTNGRGYELESSFVRANEVSGDSQPLKGYTLEEWSTLILEKGWLT